MRILINHNFMFDKYQDKQQAYKDLGITRYCCMRMLLTSIDTYDFFKDYTTENLHPSITLKTELSEDRIYNAR